MRDQWVKLVFDAKSGDPDAAIFARRFAAFVSLLRSVDENEWKINSPRYAWEIESASKTNPFVVEMRARPRNADVTGYDVVGHVTDGLRRLELGPNSDLVGVFDDHELKTIPKLVRTTKQEQMVVFSIEYKENGHVASYTPTKALVQNAKQVRIQSPPPPDEYIATEGELRWIEANMRGTNPNCHFGLIERGTGRNIDCVFLPQSRETLGAHVGYSVFVEGFLRHRAEGSNPRLTVEAFRLIPKASIPLDEVHRRRLRVPDGEDAESFVSRLRADFG